MRTFRNVISLTMVGLFLQGWALGQDTTKRSERRWGIGIAVTDGVSSLGELLVLEGLISPVVFIPIDVTPKLRLEPEVEIFRSSSGGRDYSSSSTNLSLGFGLLAMVRTGNVNVYYGVRFGIIRQSSSFEYDGDRDEDTEQGFRIAGVVGGEHYLGDRFTLGGEAQLSWISFSDRDATIFGTRGLLFVRFYS